VGFTAQIRDASIRLRQGAVTARKDNTGFVPLLHGAFERRLGADWRLEGDMDALAGGPGYAVDAGLRLSRRVGGDWHSYGTVRYVDGGANKPTPSGVLTSKRGLAVRMAGADVTRFAGVASGS
jgi:hypothetical protein